MAAMNLKLLANVCPMGLDRPPADAQVLSDLSARLVIRDQSQDMALGRSKVQQSWAAAARALRYAAAVDQIGRQGRACVVLSPGNGTDAAYYISDRAVFEHISFDAEFERRAQEALFPMHSQQDDFDRYFLFSQPTRHRQSVQPRHLYIQDDNPGSVDLNGFQRAI